MHVSHAVHAATVFTPEAERDTRERAAEEHEQKDQRCKPLLHLSASHCRKGSNQSQYSFTGTNCAEAMSAIIVPVDSVQAFCQLCPTM
jgi:hypothetical protein